MRERNRPKKTFTKKKKKKEINPYLWIKGVIIG